MSAWTLDLLDLSKQGVDECIDAMNELNRKHCDMTVIAPPEDLPHTVPVKLWSGLAFLGASGVPAREYNRRTRLHWRGPAGSSQYEFVFPQTDQSYPSSGAPRDKCVRYIEHIGRKGTHFLPKKDPTTWSNENAKFTLWATEIRDCGWKEFDTVWWGWGDLVSFATGCSHIQNCYDTPINVGGSECTIFDESKGGFDSSLQADAKSGYPGWGQLGKPLLRSYLSKSKIGAGPTMTARQKAFCIEVAGGHGLWIDTGILLDAQTSDPMDGPALRIVGGTGIHVAASIKGAMDRAADYPDAGFIDVTGGDQIIVQGSHFDRRQNNAPVDTPIVSTREDAGRVKIGLNSYEGFSPIRARQLAGKITTLDPEVRVVAG